MHSVTNKHLITVQQAALTTIVQFEFKPGSHRFGWSWSDQFSWIWRRGWRGRRWSTKRSSAHGRLPFILVAKLILNVTTFLLILNPAPNFKASCKTLVWSFSASVLFTGRAIGGTFVALLSIIAIICSLIGNARPISIDGCSMCLSSRIRFGEKRENKNFSLCSLRCSHSFGIPARLTCSSTFLLRPPNEREQNGCQWEPAKNQTCRLVSFALTES